MLTCFIFRYSQIFEAKTLSDKSKKYTPKRPTNFTTPTKNSPNDTIPALPNIQDDFGENEIEATVRIDRRDIKDQIKKFDEEDLFWVVRVTAGQDMLSFVVLLTNDKAWLGRGPSSDLQINDRTVSKRQALLLTKPAHPKSDAEHDRLFLIDEFSTNGTIVNRQNKRSRVKKIELQKDDRIEIGDVSLVVNLMNRDELSHLKRVVAQLKAANHDPLTGLLTRAFEETKLPQIVSQTEVNKEPISCCFIDMDKFKDINDTFGHNIGDEVLKNFSRIILFHLRSTDHCIRRGGDEFLVILPGTNESTAKRIFERIRVAIQMHYWERIASGLQPSASFGIAEKKPDDSIETWIDQADQAVYISKNTGRNKVYGYSEGLHEPK